MTTYIGTGRKYFVRKLKSDVAEANNQQKIIDQELALIRAYVLEKSYSFNMLNADPTSPKAWQLYSTYARALPPDLVLSEENILDVIGFLIFMLSASRKEDMFSQFSQTVTTGKRAVVARKLEPGSARRPVPAKIAKRLKRLKRNKK